MSINIVTGFLLGAGFYNYFRANTRVDTKPQSKVKPTSCPSFGYKNILKTEWRKGKLPTVKYGFYGDKLTQENLSLEHLQAHSKGGKTNLTNLVLASKPKNEARGNRDIRDFIDKQKAINYLKQFIDVKVKDFNGNKYIAEIVKTLRKLDVDI